jgi:hypothetical protein
MKSYKRTISIFGLLVIVAFLATLSIFYNGIPVGNDRIQHYQFAQTIYQTIISGQLYPSFANSINQGLGDVGIRFYPPLSYYILSVFYFFTQNWAVASQISFFFVFLCGGIGTYFWSRESFSVQQSIIASAFYVLAPYHLNQIYNNFLLAEFFSTAFIPFCFLFVTRICQKSKTFDVIGLAFFYALLILTHLPLTIITSISLTIYALFFLNKKNLLNTLPKLLISVFGSLILTSFYWIKLVTEMNWVKHSSPKYFSDIWNYKSNFLMSYASIFDYKDDVLSLWLANLMFLAIILISIPALVLLIKEKFVTSRFNLAIFFVFLFSIFMITPLSQFIWDNFTFLQKVQFPWRCLGIASLFGSIFASIGINHIFETAKEKSNNLVQIGLAVVLVFFVFTSTYIVRVADFTSSANFNKQIDNMKQAKSFDCWWTIWFNEKAFTYKDKKLITDRNFQIENWEAEEKLFSIEKGESKQMSVAIFYYPHWKLLLNDKITEVVADDNGLISFSVPSEKVEAKLYFSEPIAVKTANNISFLGWLFTFVLLIYFSSALLKTSYKQVNL